MDKKIKLSDPIITLLLFLSIIFFIFLTVEYQEVIITYPPDPRITYNQEIARIYLTATDWKTIHFAENNIDLSILDSDTSTAVIIKNWENYKKNPLEYQGGYGKKLWENNNTAQVTQFQIIIDRESYLSQNFSSQSSSERMLSDLNKINKTSSDLISQLTNRIDSSSYDPDVPLYDDFAPLLLSAIESFEQTIWFPVPTYVAYYFPSYKPKYQAIVYESYKALPINISYFGTSLSEISFEILTNQKEDLYLQIMVLEKLSQPNNDDKIRPRFISTLYELLTAGENRGAYLSQGYTRDEQMEFRILILKYLSQEVNEERDYLFQKAQETTNEK